MSGHDAARRRRHSQFPNRMRECSWIRGSGIEVWECGKTARSHETEGENEHVPPPFLLGLLHSMAFFVFGGQCCIFGPSIALAFLAWQITTSSLEDTQAPRRVFPFMTGGHDSEFLGLRGGSTGGGFLARGEDRIVGLNCTF